MQDNHKFLFTGLSDIHPEVFNLNQILKETMNSEPILLLTSGNDPSAEIRQLAQNIVGNKNYIEVSSMLLFAMLSNIQNSALFNGMSHLQENCVKRCRNTCIYPYPCASTRIEFNKK